MEPSSDDPVWMLEAILQHIFGDEEWDLGNNAESVARRVLAFWQDFAPDGEEELPFVPTTFPAIAQQMIVVRDIEFASICAHHLLPFFGVAHVAYLPHKLQIGVSKIPRIVQYYAQRPQVQERLTHQIADWMQDMLEPKGSAVIIEAKHTCMSCRGVLSRGSSMITSEIRGVYLTNRGAQQEFMGLIGKGGGMG